MIFELTPRIIYETHRLFEEAQSKYILETFMKTDFLCDYKDEVERIRLAILYGSKSNISEFDNYIKLSTIDYRDVLLNSECGNENWKSFLIEAGFNSLEDNNFNIKNINNLEYRK
jgi:hypothetical protein